MKKPIYETPGTRILEVRVRGKILDGSYNKSFSMETMDVDDDELDWNAN